MPIDEQESAIQQNDSIELYTFTIGTSPFTLTTYYKNFDYESITYVATAGLRRNGYQKTIDTTPSECQITIPSDHALVYLLKNPNAVSKCNLLIEKRFIDDPTESEIIFSGDLVGGTELTDGFCTMKFKDIMYLCSREICKVRVQSLCNNRLFDETCALLETNYKFSVNVFVDETGKILTLASPLVPSRDSGYFAQGRLVYNGISRYITKQDGLDLYINFPIDGLDVSGSVDIYPGCDKTPLSCDTKFLVNAAGETVGSNLTNFVGMPYVPTKDPQLIPLTSASI